MENSWKYVVAGFFFCLVIAAILFLFTTDFHAACTFLAQSFVDNAIFCGMFLLVVIVTGINC